MTVRYFGAPNVLKLYIDLARHAAPLDCFANDNG